MLLGNQIQIHSQLKLKIQKNKMKKRIILGDVHGRYDIVESIYNKEQPDEVIVLGDYVDTHEMISDYEQHKSLDNLLILREKHLDTNKGKFILLFGNHDFHYYYDSPMFEQYSGYSYQRAKWATSVFKELIKNNVMQAVYIDKINKTIYSHAGVSNTWLNDNNISIYEINDSLKNNLGYFTFKYGKYYSPTGDNVENSCIWIRPASLLSDMYIDENNEKWTQIVGHTQGFKIQCFNENGISKLNDANLILCDCLSYEYLIEYIDENEKITERKITKV